MHQVKRMELWIKSLYSLYSPKETGRSGKVLHSWGTERLDQSFKKVAFKLVLNFNEMVECRELKREDSF